MDNAEGLGLPHVAGGTVNQHFENQRGRQFFKLSNMELPHDPTGPPLGLCPREGQTYYIYTKTCTFMFTSTLLITAKEVGTTEMSTD